MHTPLIMAMSSLHQPPLLFTLLFLLLLSLSFSLQTHARELNPTAATPPLPEAAELPPQARPSNAGHRFDRRREYSSLPSTAAFAAADRYRYREFTPSTFATEQYERERRRKYDGDGDGGAAARYYYKYYGNGVSGGERRYVGGGGGGGGDHGGDRHGVVHGRGGGDDDDHNNNNYNYNNDDNNNNNNEGYGSTNAMDECVKKSLVSQEENHEFVP